MAEFRNILADGDLIRERKQPCWWLFGEEKWQPYRNLSHEIRVLEEMMHAAHAAYKKAQENYVVAHKNVNMDMDILRKHKGVNSEAVYEIPGDESILFRRDGVKYNSNGNKSGQQQKGQNNSNGNSQQNHNGNDNGGGNNQNHNQNGKQKGGRQPQRKSLLALLANAEVTMH